MRSLFATLVSLTLPAGAASGTPRIVLGPTIPPELIAFGIAKGVTFYVGEVYYLDATTYAWVFLTDFLGIKNLMQGTYDPTNGVYVTDRRLIVGASAIETRLGSAFLNSFPMTIDFQNANVQIGSGAAFFVGGRMSSRNATYSAMTTVGNRNVNTFANVPNNPSVSITKLGDATQTDLVYWFSQGCFGGAINANVEFGADAGTGTAAGGNQFFNAALTHYNVAGGNRITNLAAGAYTVNLKWRAIAGTIQTDANDRTYLHVAECAV